MSRTTVTVVALSLLLFVATVFLHDRVSAYPRLQLWNPALEPNPGFFVMKSGTDKLHTFSPQGWGWPPNHRIDLKVFLEPRRENGELVTKDAVIGTVPVDNDTMFGFNGRTDHNVPKLCGSPPPGFPKALFMARDPITGVRKWYSVEAYEYFTNTPCR
ncbi:MAG TPA: hypothetical protein VF017_04590 [Thermoanaerobaculia bacterium]|nr:hypothetical protein [Thermoanaerobaculia bacterium]